MTTAAVDMEKLGRWMDDQGLPKGPITDVERLSGGTQNILLRFNRGGRRYVLRRGPEHLRPETNNIIAREARLLAALAGTDVPHPPFVAGCADPSVLGAAFFLTGFVQGFNATLDPPEVMRRDPALRHRMSLSLIDGIARLAAVDPQAVGLDGFGKPEGFLERQTGRWAAHLEGYARMPAWTGRDDLPGLSAIAAWLDDNLPQDYRPGIIHGDYHIGNVIYALDGSLAAIVDWEMATLGDPLVDLGRVLSTWPDHDGRMPMSLRVEPMDGFAGRDELIARYGALTGRNLSSLRWFEILSCYKLAIILEGTYARAQSGLAPMATGQRLHDSAIGLLRRALDWLDRG